MAVRQYKPTTPGRRGASVITTERLAEPSRRLLLKGKPSRAGRAHSGQITIRHRGGGSKRLYREIDFNQRQGVAATVVQLEYDPYRSAFIALLKYADGDYRYVLAESRMKSGQSIAAGDDAPLRAGNRVPLRRVPSGNTVYNIALTPGATGTIVRSAGASAQVMAHEAGFTQLKLPSGEIRRVMSSCLANLGVVSNREHENITIGKAGRSRLKGKRPHVRGKAMNPVDHPHGGGEGGVSIGLKGPKTPSGLYTLGRKTRKRQVPKSIVRRKGGR